MRLVLIGGGSFIARAVSAACRENGIDSLMLRHDQPPGDVLGKDDCLINFALDPHYRTAAYATTQDCDLRAARAAAEKGARFIMLSTRRVYGPDTRWNAVESSPAAGDETSYGRNKAASEAAIRTICGQTAAIFRLSNIFGYEYRADGSRRSFLGMVLGSLRRENRIFFDMHPDTRRDFLPVEICARQIVARAADGTSGTYNLGAGFPLACGSLAAWVMEGFGGGELVCDPPLIKDEFFLNMGRWRNNFPAPTDEDMLRCYCIELGRRLKCEKS